MSGLHEAADANDVEGLRRLLDEEPGVVDEGEVSALYYACEAGSLAAAKLLLDRGADVEKGDDSGLTPLMAACEAGYVEMVSLLLEHGADLCRRDGGGWTTLVLAALGDERAPDDRHPIASDHVAVIRLLIQDGRLPIDACDTSHGSTALMAACCRGHSDRARVLLLEGLADPTMADAYGETSLALARRKKQQACVDLLEWHEGELQKPMLLSKARALVDAMEYIMKAPEKVGAKTEAEAQKAREEAAPAYLRGRVERGEALPVVELVSQAKRLAAEDELLEEERRAVVEYLIKWLKEDLHVEFLEGLKFPGEGVDEGGRWRDH